MTTKKNSNYNPKTMIKSKFSNDIHKLLAQGYGLKPSEKRKVQKKLTDTEKLALFDKVMKTYRDSSNELRMYLYEKRKRKEIERNRVANGYYEKKKLKKDLNNSKV